MNADLKNYSTSKLTEKIIGVFFDLYNELGHGFLESVYQRAMEVALREAGLLIESQLAVPVYFRGMNIADFRCDLLVEHTLLIELKSVRTLESSHEAQTVNYLHATTIEIGLLFNFGPKPQFKRLAFHNSRKKICADQRESAAGAS